MFTHLAETKIEAVDEITCMIIDYDSQDLMNLVDYSKALGAKGTSSTTRQLV